MIINQSLIKIEELELSNTVFSMQKDGGDRRKYQGSHPLVLKPDCNYKSNCGDKCGDMNKPKQGATLLVHKHESLYCMADYSPRYVFEWEKLGLKCNKFSQVIAIKIGLLMGCKKFNFISFDAHVNGCTDSYIPGVGITSKDVELRNHVQKVKRYLKFIDYRWITPKKRKS